MPDVAEPHERRIRARRVHTLGHRPDRDGIDVTPDDRQRGRVLLDRAGPTAFVLATLLDVADRARHQTIAAVPEDELGGHLEVVVGDDGAGSERASERADERVASEPVGQPLVGQREQELLPVGEVGHVDVDGAVREDAARHLEREGPVEAAGEELSADRVAHVVGEQRHRVEPEVAGDRLDQVRLVEERIALVGLVRQAEAEEVGQHHAATAREAIEDAVPVVRRGRKAVQHEDGPVVAVAVCGCAIDDEHAMPEHSVMVTALGPPRDAFVTRHHGSIVSSAAVPVISTHKFDAGGVNLAVHDWGGDGHPVLLAHPTGFHGLTWTPVAARLVAQGRHVWSFDYRGHGDSDRSPDGYQWSEFADDVMAVVQELGLAGESTLLACGHSKGAASLLLGEAREPGTFARLWCYEPIVFPTDDPLAPQDDFPLAEGARRRRSVWSSRDEAFASYGSKPPLDVLDPDALRAYVDYGMRDRPDGQVELKCRPEDEAATYAMGTANGVYPRLRDVRCPTVVVCGEHTDAIPPQLGEMIVERLPDGRLEVMPGVGHFGPMQDPEATVESMLRFAAAT
jgi:pimeloyl-ACP methyl ester carboxylesterase